MKVLLKTEFGYMSPNGFINNEVSMRLTYVEIPTYLRSAELFKLDLALLLLISFLPCR